ncbi:GroES-like protein [Aspergillus ellipticus CBS 707.79]|uniref:GroES-like protein n=1 Tax=Aspergillus ellipticus CBS 707.79 TaxID=1448320 RepID=A0A319DPK6_9EURO|nr:GroES-like protein [Aspergillus ellipticus CBS 707.79]
MKATMWEGDPFHMSIKEQPMPKIEHPNDVVIRITTAAICGSDLHCYRGRVGSKYPPWIMGHEGIGVVVEAGEGLKSLKLGDRVIAGVISCGYCDNSQYIRIPFADSSCFKLPASTERDLDYILLTDIFPTAWYALDCAGFEPGDTVAVFGAGPVGLLCAYSALLRGASKVYSVDYVPARLAKAESIGAIPIDFTKSDPVQQILAREPRGVRCSCECVGLDCLNDKLESDESVVLNNCIKVTEPTGGIGFIGVYVPAPDGPSPGVPLATASEGVFPVLVGELWFKALSLKGGAAEIHRLQPLLRDLVESGKARPSFIIDEVLHSLDEIPRAYERFNKREIIKPVIQLVGPEN